MRNNNITSSSKFSSNAPFILIIALFIIVFIVVSYFLVSGSAFGKNYVDDLDNSNNNNNNNNSNNNNNNNSNSNSNSSSNSRSSSKEVFNIRDNVFTYNEAKAACAAYGARLATIEDMISAYDRGANWCSYGWTEGQLAMYPTQKEYWAKLQMDTSRRTECGEPGLNGGYFENPEFKFGANCFGTKPTAKKGEVEKNTVGRNMNNPYQNLISKYEGQIENNEFRISPFSEDNFSDC
jgi:hypothetical protein